MRVKIYVEGGGDKEKLKVRCREGFRNLFEKCGFARMPSFVACGGRGNAYDRFVTALSGTKAAIILLMVDSEDPVNDIEKTWDHLHARNEDQWDKPEDSGDEDVIFMTTCMETWIVADKDTLKEHYGSRLHESALPQNTDLETVDRHELQDKLAHATRDCTNYYGKGKRSFEVLGKLNPEVLKEMLPSFARAHRILKNQLG